MKKFFTFAFLAMTLISCKTDKIEITKIMVLDSNFNQLSVIQNPDTLNIISNLWSTFEPIADIPKIQWDFKLDIESKNIAGRWLYSKEGYIAKMNKELKPRFKVGSQDAFNRLILGF
ncbi:MAG: hypothetical protein C4519_13870 [Desulfobacteraceae bacterium]|nr:MAG: hypothetical protein C4519_13870 [Desulfobacteraceae bacterium]